MSADQFAPAPQLFDDELIDSFIVHYEISEHIAEKIRNVMQTEKVCWSEAAALSGLLTTAQVEEAIRWTGRTTEQSTDGVIETALKRSTSRSVVTVEGPEVTPQSALVFARDPYDPRSEKMRALRTELLLLNNSSAMFLAVVGSGPCEGRSVLAAELALAFGQLGRRTLLVDADMRKPSQHVLFGVENTVGFAQSLDGSHQGIMYRVSGSPAMSLLTAGTATSNPFELLSGQRFSRMADTWRKQFEFIILDTPPVCQYADGLTIATLAGNVLVVGRSTETEFRAVKEMLRRLALTRSQILGAVINHF